MYAFARFLFVAGFGLVLTLILFEVIELCSRKFKNV
jgi:hypothetical protein